MMHTQAYAFMGGTFDPIHNGHLRTALELQQWLGIERLALVPANIPAHRGMPKRTAQQRLEMTRLAVQDEAGLMVDSREVAADGPSYSWLTLESLRSELGTQTPLCMIMGMDAYLSLPSWHRWDELLDLCHIIVVQRPGFVMSVSDPMYHFTEQHKVDQVEELFASPCGRVIVHELTPLGISATQIRQTLSAGKSPRYLMPDAVWQYIQDNRLYGVTN